MNAQNIPLHYNIFFALFSAITQVMKHDAARFRAFGNIAVGSVFFMPLRFHEISLLILNYKVEIILQHIFCFVFSYYTGDEAWCRKI